VNTGTDKAATPDSALRTRDSGMTRCAQEGGLCSVNEKLIAASAGYLAQYSVAGDHPPACLSLNVTDSIDKFGLI